MAEMKAGGKIYASQYKAVAKYEKEHYDFMKVRFPKGKKDEVASKIKEMGYESLNSFVMDAIDEKLARK